MNRALLHFALALTLFAIGSVGYVLWYGAVSAQSAQAASLAAQVAAKKSTLGRVAATKAAVTSLQGEEVAMEQYFVSEGTIVAFIGGLQEKGQKLGATVTVNSVSADTQGTRPTLTLSFTVDGSFDAVMRTVGSIEYAPYDLTTTGLSVQKNANGWEAQFTVVVGSVPGGVSASTGATPKQPAAAARSSAAVPGAQPL